jgi:hypothetical protein
MHLTFLLAAFTATIFATPIEPIQSNATATAVGAAAPTIPAAPGAATAPTVLVKNHCPFPLYISSVGLAGANAAPAEIPSYGSWTEPEYFSGTGTAINVYRAIGDLYATKPVLVLGYTYTAGVNIYYDIGTSHGNPLPGGTIKLAGKGGETVWYGVEQPSHTLAYFGETDLTLDLCL